jgi:putative PIN family toxin of toxin-antitoxin system
VQAVIDTNELLRLASAWRMHESPLLTAWRQRRFDLAWSEAMLDEFARVADRPKMRRRLPEENVQQFMAFARKRAVWVEPYAGADMPHCRDAKDDVVIATAIAARAQFIVTNDGDLHDPTLAARLRDEYGIQVVWPGEFLEAI